MKLITLLCLSTLSFASLFASSFASAESIHGFVTVESNQVYLTPLPKQAAATRLTISTSFQIRATLVALKTGDFVILSGQLSDSDRDGIIDEVIAEGIESVGLKDLIGTWRSSKWQVVRFETFNRMTLYRSQIDSPMGSSRRRLAKLKDLSYSLAPELGSAYSIFLVEKQPAVRRPAAIYVGRIELQKNTDRSGKSLVLEIFDPKTGQSAEVITLSPVRD